MGDIQHPTLFYADLEHVLDHTQDIWESLKGERIFITGGSGFFGCWLLETLTYANDRLNANIQATVLTRNPEAFCSKAPHLAGHNSISLVQGDVRTFSNSSAPGAFSHVIHAATEASAKLNNEQPMVMLDTIVEGTRRTLEFAVNCKAQRFLHTSSGGVYGRQPTDMTHISEDYAGGPDTMRTNSAYGEGKRTAELLCTLYSHGHSIQTVNARCFALVGPYLPLDIHFAMGNFIRDGLLGQTITVNADGTPYRSYMYAADLAIWLWVLLAKGENCRCYNVGSDFGIPIGEVAHTVQRAFDGSVDVVIREKPVPGRPAERYVPSIDRARSELGLDTWIGLDEGIRRTIAWNRNQELR